MIPDFFAPPRVSLDQRDKSSIVIAHGRPLFCSQESVDLLGALTRAVLEES